MIRIAIRFRKASEVLNIIGDPHGLKSIFTDSELEYCSRAPNGIESLAARWAAKDALQALFVEVLEWSHCSTSDMAIERVPAERPHARLSLRLSQRLRERGFDIEKIQVSLAHAGGVGVAVVVLGTTGNDTMPV